MPKVEKLLLSIREILLQEWDPLGVNDNESCRNEYDSYAPTVCRYLREGADEYKLAAHLCEIQRVSMGMSVSNEDLNRRVARRLLSLMK